MGSYKLTPVAPGYPLKPPTSDSALISKYYSLHGAGQMACFHPFPMQCFYFKINAGPLQIHKYHTDQFTNQ